MSENRDNETGQFTPAEPLTGQAGVEADYGAGVPGIDSYKPMPDPEDRPEPESDLRTEVERLQASRVPEPPVADLTYFKTDTGEKTDPNETVSLERAAKDLSTYHGQQDGERARSVSSDFADEIDKMRADAIKENPELVKDLGLSKEDVAAAEAAKEPAVEAQATPNVEPTSEPDQFDSIDGLEPETREALKKPQVRQFLEQTVAETETVKQAYSTGLHQGQQMMQATVAALAPQLQGVPLEQWPQAIQMIAQVDPVRGKLVADTLSNWAAIQQAEQQQKQYQTHAERQQFETQREQYNRQCDQVLGPMTHAERAQAAEDLVGYLTQYGITREQLLHESKTNLMLAHPAFNALAMDALKYRAMQKAAKPIAQKNLPPVSRPGTTPVHRSSGDVSSKIQSLQKQLETATGHKAARISAELLAAKRNAANR